MNVMAVLNRDGGTFKAMDLDELCRHLRDCFERAGHGITCQIVQGAAVEGALHEAAADPRCDAIVAGGGDGTISAAASHAWKAQKVLGVLPAGTMNLFARSLGLPLEPYEAANAIAHGRRIACDIGTANGRLFLHQLSVGLQASVVKLRDATPRRTKLGKLLGGLGALRKILQRPPTFSARLCADGRTREGLFSLLAVSNNPYGEGHIPYAESLDGGCLGVYSAGRLTAGAGTRLCTDLALGAWRSNPDLYAGEASVVDISFPYRKSGSVALIDGEILPLEQDYHLEIHPGALSVLAPA